VIITMLAGSIKHPSISSINWVAIMTNMDGMDRVLAKCTRVEIAPDVASIRLKLIEPTYFLLIFVLYSKQPTFVYRLVRSGVLSRQEAGIARYLHQNQGHNRSGKEYGEVGSESGKRYRQGCYVRQRD
jgi:hypothetical protein